MVQPYETVWWRSGTRKLAGAETNQQQAPNNTSCVNRQPGFTIMKKVILLAASLSAVLATASLSHASEVPCEESLKQLRALETSSMPGDAVKAEVAKLEAKGVERCNADDDKRANEFFAQATKLLAK